jgi:GNAT superfamily N-acetyltransferase
MIFREATTGDIREMQTIRNAVYENRLSDPGLVTDEACATYITKRGKGWVCIFDGCMAGFSIADLEENNIWALFVHPRYEKKGIGTQLHDIMLDWYFAQQKEYVWLSTAPGTRAERFYRKAGWTATGTYGKGELKFEMTKESWWQRLPPGI